MEEHQQQQICNIQFIAKIVEKPPLKSLKKKRSTSSLNKSKTMSKSTSRSRSKSKERKSSILTSQIPKGNGNVITIGKKLSKGQESFTFDKVFDKGQILQEMYKAAFQPLVHQFVFENKNISIIHNGNIRSKQRLWINDVNSIDDGLYGKLIDDIFDQITLKNLQNGDGQLITVKMSFYEITNFQENIIDFLNDQSPYQNMESMIVSKEIFDLDDFLEIIQYIQENNLFSITEKQGRTQICKIRLQGANTNCEMNFINLEDIDNMNKEREEYYCGFFKEIKDTYINQGLIQSKNQKFYNFSRLTQMLQSSFNQNSTIIVLSSFISDSKQHLPNLQGLKLTKRFQNIFKFEEESPHQTKVCSVLTTNYNTNDQNQSHQILASGSNQNFYPSGSNQNFNPSGSNPNFYSGSHQNFNGSASAQNFGMIRNSSSKNMYGNNQSSPGKLNLFSNQTSNFQSVQPYEELQYPVFGQGDNRSRGSTQFVEAEKNVLNNNSLFSSNQFIRNHQVDQINSEIDQVNESIQHPPVAQSTFFTQWIKNKAEFIENILTNICQNKTVDGESKNFLLDKVLNLKSQLQNLNEIQNTSPRSLPDRLLRNFDKKRTSSSPDLKQQREKMFEYFETPRFELEGRKRYTDGQRVSVSHSDQKMMQGRDSIKSVIKSPSNQQMNVQHQKFSESHGNYYNQMKPVYYRRQIQESEDEISRDSIDTQLQKAMQKKKQQKTINFKGTKKPADKKSTNSTKQKKSSLSKKRGSSTGLKDLNNSQANLSTLSKKSTQSRKSILSRKSITSQKSAKSGISQKSEVSKKSATSKTSKKSGISKSSKLNKSQTQTKAATSKPIVGQRKSSSSLVKKINPGSKRGSGSQSNQQRISLTKSIKSPTSLNRSRSSGQGDNSMQTLIENKYNEMRNYKDMKDNILQDLDFKTLRSENSPSLSHSRKTSLSKSPKFTPRQLNVPALRGRSLSRDFQTQSLEESHNQSYNYVSTSPIETNPQNFQNAKIKDHLKQQYHQQLQQGGSGLNTGSFSQAVQNTNLNKVNSNYNNNINNLFSGSQSTQVQIRQNIKEHLKTFRDMVESSSSESDYDLHYQISNIQPSMPMRKSYKFQSKVKEFDLSFENEKKFFIEQQGKNNQTDLLKNYHKLLLKSYDIQKLLDEQVNINDELQKEVFTQEEKFNILQRKHLKKKKEKQLIKKEMSDKLLEFEKMEQRDAQSRQQMQQQQQKMQNIQIQNEQQDKIIRNLEVQIQEIRESYESRISELEETNDSQKIQIEKLSDIIKRNQLSEMDLRSQLNSKSQQFDHDIKTKREEFERQLALNQLSIKQIQTSKSIELQAYDKKLSEAAEDVERLKQQLVQMKQKVDTGIQVQRANEETLNNFRREKAELADRVEELESENQQLRADKMILQHKHSSIMHQTIASQIQSERNIKQIEQSLLYYKTKQQDQSEKDYNPPSSYRQALEFESRAQRKLGTPQNSTQQKTIQNLTTIPTNMYQNVNYSSIPLQTQSQNNLLSNLQQQYLTSSPNQPTNNNQNISVSQYEIVNSARELKSERNSSSPQQVSQIINPSQQIIAGPSQIMDNIKDLINTPNSTKVSKKSKDSIKTKRINREPKEIVNEQQQLLSTQRENKKSSSLPKSKNQLTTRMNVAPKLKKKI